VAAMPEVLPHLKKGIENSKLKKAPLIQENKIFFQHKNLKFSECLSALYRILAEHKILLLYRSHI
jgi:hypothetical protein